MGLPHKCTILVDRRPILLQELSLLLYLHTRFGDYNADYVHDEPVNKNKFDYIIEHQREPDVISGQWQANIRIFHT